MGTTKKTKEQLLEQFKRANQDYKAVILKREGYATAEEYITYLSGKNTAKTGTGKASKVTKAEDTLDMVIAFDTTGSMASYIGSVKQHVEKVVGDLFNNTDNLQIKIVAFGDYCDMQSRDKFGKAYQETALTNNQNDLVKFVKSAQNTSGGDTDEFYELVIKKIVNETPWRKGSKSILLIGDCAPHPLGYSHGGFVTNNQIDWRKECENAKSLGIQIDTLSIMGNKFYEEVAKITGGVCIPFKSAGKVDQVITGTAYKRASKFSDKATSAFMCSTASAMSSGDSELIGAYKTMSTID